MVTIRYIWLLLILFLTTFNINAEGTYELRGKSSANSEVRIDGKRDGYAGNDSFGLPRVTIFYVDIEDAANEVIDLYTKVKIIYFTKQLCKGDCVLFLNLIVIF